MSETTLLILIATNALVVAWAVYGSCTLPLTRLNMSLMALVIVTSVFVTGYMMREGAKHYYTTGLPRETPRYICASTPRLCEWVLSDGASVCVVNTCQERGATYHAEGNPYLPSVSNAHSFTRTLRLNLQEKVLSTSQPQSNAPSFRVYPSP